jgi:hypothetical protein
MQVVMVVVVMLMRLPTVQLRCGRRQRFRPPQAEPQVAVRPSMCVAVDTMPVAM